jgi:hypothetical protein
MTHPARHPPSRGLLAAIGWENDNMSACLCAGRRTRNARICRICGVATRPLRHPRRQAAVVSGQQAAGVPGVNLAHEVRVGRGARR